MMLTRRHVLAAMAAVPVAGALGGGSLALRWYNKGPAAGRILLSSDEYDFIQSLAEAWMPPGGVPALSGADADLGAWFDELLTHMAPNQQTLLKLLVQILDDVPLVTDASTFRGLSLPRRVELLGEWLDASNPLFRAGVSGVIVLIGMGWTTHPDVAHVLAPRFRCGWSR